MVGRLIVGKPAGPDPLPFDYFVADPQQRGWRLCPSRRRLLFRRSMRYWLQEPYIRPEHGLLEQRHQTGVRGCPGGAVPLEGIPAGRHVIC